jgi:hypothetical protein
MNSGAGGLEYFVEIGGFAFEASLIIGFAAKAGDGDKVNIRAGANVGGQQQNYGENQLFQTAFL